MEVLRELQWQQRAQKAQACPSMPLTLPPFVWTLGGTWATLRARPKAPGKELLSRTTNVPGGLSFNMLMAANPIGERRSFLPISLEPGSHYISLRLTMPMALNLLLSTSAWHVFSCICSKPLQYGHLKSHHCLSLR